MTSGSRTRIWRRPAFQRGSSTLVLTVAVISLLILVNVLGARYHRRADWTRGRTNTLADQTISILQKLDRDVQIMAFFQKGSYQASQMRDLLMEYKSTSAHIRVVFIDPEKNPSLAKLHDLIELGTIVMVMGNKSRRIGPYNLYDMGSVPSQRPFRGEQALTRSLVELLGLGQAAVYFLQGHGEPDIWGDYSILNSFLEGEGFTTKALNLPTEEEVPLDAGVVVIGGLKRDISAGERQELESYLDRAGKLIVLAGPTAKAQQLGELDSLLNRYGVALADDLVVEPERSYFFDVLSPMPKVRDHDITRKLVDNNLAVVLPQARSLMVAWNTPSGLVLDSLLDTSEKAWGEKDWEVHSRVQKGPEDTPGPLTLAVAVSREAAAASLDDKNAGAGKQSPQRLAVIFGNSSFVDNKTISFQGNVNLLVNAVEWLLGNEAIISIRAREPQLTPVRLNTGQAIRIFYGTVVIMPLVLASIGVVVWLRRRLL